jgi:hypothetical protein
MTWERVAEGLPFTSVMDLFYFIGILVIAGFLVIWTVGRIAAAIKADDKIFGGD